MVDVGSLEPVIGMLLELDPEIEIPGLAACTSGTALTGQPDPLSLAHAHGNLDSVGLHVGGVPLAEGDLAGGAVQHLVKGDEDIGLDVAASLGCLLEIRPATEPPTATRAEELLEEITVAGSTEVELGSPLPNGEPPTPKPPNPPPWAEAEAPPPKPFPACCQLAPYSSYLRRFSGSLRTS